MGGEVNVYASIVLSCLQSNFPNYENKTSKHMKDSFYGHVMKHLLKLMLF